MTANKAQGQTLKHVGIYLGKNEFFSHGQFYVAFSRVTDPKNIKFFLDDAEKGTTMNVVYPKALENWFCRRWSLQLLLWVGTLVHSCRHFSKYCKESHTLYNFFSLLKFFLFKCRPIRFHIEN